MVKKIVPVLFLIGLVAWGVYDYTQNSDHPSQPTNPKENNQEQTGEKVIGIDQGNLAPDFTLQTLQGESMTLSDYRGKNVIINFWATWCPPCRAEMPHMQRYYDEHKDDDFTILAVNMTTTESHQSDVQPFIDELAITFPVLLDVDNDVTDTYQVMAYPTSYFVDKNGVIQYKILGAMNEEMMEKQIALMSE